MGLTYLQRGRKTHLGKRNILVLICCCLFQVGAAQQAEISRLQSEIDQYFRKQPSEAAEKLKLLLEYQDKLPDTVTAEAFRKLGVSMIAMAAYDAADSSFQKGLEKAQNLPQLRAHILINQAISYRSASKHTESLETLSQAMEVLEDIGDKSGIGTVYGEMASNYNYMLEPELAIEYLKKGIAILEEEGAHSQLTVLKQKLANSYFNNGNFEFAKSLYQEVLPVFKEEHSSNYYYTLINYGDCLFYLENYPMAFTSYKEAVQGLREVNNISVALFAVAKQARVAALQQNDQLALKLYQEAFDGLASQKSPRLGQVTYDYLQFLNGARQYEKSLGLVNRYKTLLEGESQVLNQNYRDELALLGEFIPVYKNTGNLEAALQAYERYVQLNDSITQVRNEEQIAEIQEKYQNQLQMEKNAALVSNIGMLHSNLEKKNRVLYLSAAVIFLLIFSGYFLYVRMRDKEKLKQLKIENLASQKKIIEARHRQEEGRRLEKEKLIEAKKREIIASTMELSGLEQDIRNLMKEEASSKDFNLFQKRLLKILEDKNYWRDFQTRFTQIHPHFFRQWEEKYPVLSKNDLQFCSLLKIGLSNKEIAKLLGISPNSVITKKYRLKKKLKIKEDAEFEQLFNAA